MDDGVDGTHSMYRRQEKYTKSNHLMLREETAWKIWLQKEEKYYNVYLKSKV